MVELSSIGFFLPPKFHVQGGLDFIHLNLEQIGEHADIDEVGDVVAVRLWGRPASLTSALTGIA